MLIMLNFGQPKKQMHKTQPELPDHMRQNSLWSTATKHLTLNRIKESFRDDSQGRSGFSSEESRGLLWDGAVFLWVILWSCSMPLPWELHCTCLHITHHPQFDPLHWYISYEPEFCIYLIDTTNPALTTWLTYFRKERMQYLLHFH